MKLASLIGLGGVLLVGFGCGQGTTETPEAVVAPPVEGIFRDATTEVGVDFRHFNGMCGEFYYCEMIGAGAAVFDYDGDGDVDLYFIQGHMLRKDISEARFPPQPGQLPFQDRLYRNELVETGTLRFVDVTEEARIKATGYGMGVATGDYDRDGDVDFYLANFGSNQLWRNNGDGTFTDVTAELNVDDERWSCGAAFFDYDLDGYLDLFVVNYVNFNLSNNTTCYSRSGARDYCAPTAFSGLPDRLYHNLGDGTFEDASGKSRIGLEHSSGLGVVCADFNGDDLIDIFVTNDGRANLLWINNGDQTFRNDALLAGVAFNATGMAEASMGVEAADYDNDGDFDLFMTHIDSQTNTYYRNNGKGEFEDRSLQVGLGAPSRAFTGFGTCAVDADGDSWLDVVTVNGAVIVIEKQAAANDPYPLHQTNQFFRNLGDGRFKEASDEAGPALAGPSEVSRGAALGDLDNDGDMDLVISNNEGPARILLNEVGNRNPWIRLVVRDPEGRIDLLGSVVEVKLSGGRSLWRRVRTDASYASAHDPRVLVNIPQGETIESVRVHYPGGAVDEWTGLATNRTHILRKKSE